MAVNSDEEYILDLKKAREDARHLLAEWPKINKLRPNRHITEDEYPLTLGELKIGHAVLDLEQRHYLYFVELGGHAYIFKAVSRPPLFYHTFQDLHDFLKTFIKSTQEEGSSLRALSSLINMSGYERENLSWKIRSRTGIWELDGLKVTFRFALMSTDWSLDLGYGPILTGNRLDERQSPEKNLSSFLSYLESFLRLQLSLY